MSTEDRAAKPFDATFTRMNREIKKTIPVRIAELGIDASKVDEIVRGWVIANAQEAIGEALIAAEVDAAACLSSYGEFIGYSIVITKEVK